MTKICDKTREGIDENLMTELHVGLRAQLNILTHIPMYSVACFQVELPTSYDAGDGIRVNASEHFSPSLVRGAWAMGSQGGVLFEVTEEGDYTFANNKFVLRPKFPTASHNHTIDIENGAVTNIAITKPSGNGVALAGGVVGGSGAATGLTGIQENTNGKATEVPDTTDLQALTGLEEIWIGCLYD